MPYLNNTISLDKTINEFLAIYKVMVTVDESLFQEFIKSFSPEEILTILNISEDELKKLNLNFFVPALAEDGVIQASRILSVLNMLFLDKDIKNCVTCSLDANRANVIEILQRETATLSDNLCSLVTRCRGNSQLAYNLRLSLIAESCTVVMVQLQHLLAPEVQENKEDKTFTILSLPDEFTEFVKGKEDEISTCLSLPDEFIEFVIGTEVFNPHESNVNNFTNDNDKQPRAERKRQNESTDTKEDGKFRKSYHNSSPHTSERLNPRAVPAFGNHATKQLFFGNSRITLLQDIINIDKNKTFGSNL